jgi:hypothetical protein
MRRLIAWLFARADSEGSRESVSAACLRYHLRAECAQGVDLPRWRTPDEIAIMREPKS